MVIFHFDELSKDIKNGLLFTFGYDDEKARKKARNGKELQKCEAFAEWYIPEERKDILRLLQRTRCCISLANSIYPTNQMELDERRLNQSKAIGYCYALLSALQDVIKTLPVSVGKYDRYAKSINEEIALLKGWRKSDNKFKKKFRASSTNNGNAFANYNNNGNANYNNATNVNDVRPDFVSASSQLEDCEHNGRMQKGEDVLP